MATRTVSNAERKRLARAKLLVEQQRAQKAEEGSITSFRMEELYWKNRTDEPGWDLAFYDNSKAIQWHSDLDQPASDDGQAGSWTDRSGSEWRVQKWKLANDKAAYCFPDNPGLIVLPGFLDVPQQQTLIAAALHETTGPASRTNLDSHYHPPQSGWWSRYVVEPSEIVETKAANASTTVSAKPAGERVQVDLKPMDKTTFLKDQTTTKEEPLPSETVQALPVQALIRKLRWTIIGLEYHWGTKSYKWDRPPMPMPQVFRETCQNIASTMPWSQIPLANNSQIDTSDWQTYKPEAGVVNFYQYRDSLTAHIDQSEVDSVRPLISISLGESCIFLAGGKTRDVRPIPFLLESGDVVIMAGEGRRVFHGVPRIIESRCSAHFDWSHYEDGRQIDNFLQGTRININVRQVFSEPV